MEERKPKVFICEAKPFDYSPAQVYGELHLMKGPQFTPNAPTAAWNDDAVLAIRKQLLDYIPDVDYLIPTGSPARIAVVAMLLSERGPVHRILQWDKRSSRYVEYKIRIP